MTLAQFRLDGRVALVTGASSRGIGNGSAKILAEAGAKVFLVARREERLRAAAAEIEAAGGSAAFAVADVSDEAQCKAAVDACVSRFGGVDVMVLASGISGLAEKSLDDAFDTDNYRRVLGINMDGVYFMMKHGYAECARGGHGSIVLVNSLAGFSAAGSAAYAASKGAVRAWTQNFAKKLAPLGVRVNAVVPGLVDTEMTHPEGMDDLFEKCVAPAAAKVPLGRLGTIDDIANGVLYLASDASSWVTGHSILIDGGELA
jgi:NAD(P)-dependent dehydrogenase (short-subunit alcohol dehydrogenase family)